MDFATRTRRAECADTVIMRETTVRNDEKDVVTTSEGVFWMSY